jgi:hypothetical protein
MAYLNEASVLLVCAVPKHGYKRAAIRRDPMPTAIVMAQQKPLR